MEKELRCFWVKSYVEDRRRKDEGESYLTLTYGPRRKISCETCSEINGVANTSCGKRHVVRY